MVIPKSPSPDARREIFCAKIKNEKMPNFPPILIELWEALAKIVDKFISWLTTAARFIWGVLAWLFERFVDVIQYIADKL